MSEVTLNSLDKKLDLLIQSTTNAFERIHEMDEVQNDQLREHMSRCDALEDQNEQSIKYFDKQLEELRKPYDFLIRLGKVFIWGVGTCTSILILVEAASKVF